MLFPSLWTHACRTQHRAIRDLRRKRHRTDYEAAEPTVTLPPSLPPSPLASPFLFYGTPRKRRRSSEMTIAETAPASHRLDQRQEDACGALESYRALRVLQ
ncbi:hypothetical protein BHE74_00017091 [Ensete ventricosum]|nr:hypothetical protein GW17_00040907 [Ensete ventricosum]RWW74910.1 hypothetical protein BHE74_00017091 [Ensete ventricosum]RZR90306.1 hypothetical protein BHM03_00018176 [Ensete ventricosum]